MPLFCTLANQFTTTTTPDPDIFENKGYPLMFETKNKHMFFVDPGEDLNDEDKRIVHKFYGAPLSVIHSSITYNGTNYSLAPMLPSNLGFITPSSCTNRYKYNYNVSFGQSFNVISRIVVSDHKINANFCSVILPNETTLSLGRSTSSITPKHGESFDVVSSLSVSNHKITPTYTTVNLPESYLYASSYHQFITSSHGLIYAKKGAYLFTKNEEKNIKLLIGDNIDITVGSEYNPPGILSIGNTGSSITISANNDHIAEHGATSNNETDPVLIMTNNGFNGDEETDMWQLVGGGATTITGKNRIITISSVNDHSVSHDTQFSGKTLQLTKNGSSGTSLLNMFTFNAGNGIDISISGKTVTFNNTKPNTDENVRSFVTDNNKFYISGKTSNQTNLVSTENISNKAFVDSGVIYSNNERTLTVTSAGVVEAGRYIDFHLENFATNDSKDYCCRLQDDSSSSRVVKLPNNGGTLPVSNEHSKNSANKIVTDIRVVTALPSDAGSYPNTLFLVTGG